MLQAILCITSVSPKYIAIQKALSVVPVVPLRLIGKIDAALLAGLITGQSVYCVTAGAIALDATRGELI